MVARTNYAQEDGTISTQQRKLNRANRYFKSLNNPIIVGNVEIIEAVIENFFSCVCWGKLYTKELWGGARFPEGIDLGEDMMTVPPLLVRANRAAYAGNAVYHWRQRKKSLLNGSVTPERLEMDFRASAEMFRRLVEYAPEHEEGFRGLKRHYDFGCYSSYCETQREPKKRSSLLYKLYDLKEKVETVDKLSKLWGGEDDDQRQPRTTPLRQNH